MSANNELRYFNALKRISSYLSVKGIRSDSEQYWGLPFQEALEMAYESVIYEAKQAIKGRRAPTSGNAQKSGRDPVRIVLGNERSDPKESAPEVKHGI